MESERGDPRALPACLPTENPHKLVDLWELMKAFQAHTLLSTVRNLGNLASLVFESKRGPVYRLEAVRGFRVL